MCTAAHTRYVGYRELMIMTGRWKPFVPADRSRAHLLILQANGVSPAAVANLTGLHLATVRVIIGQPGRRVTKVRPHTEAAILGVDPDPANIHDGSLVPAVGTQRRLQGLMFAGWSIPQLAAGLGLTYTPVYGWLRADRVTAGSARKVAALADRLWKTPPPERTWRERGAATRARNTAQANGWVPLTAWDEDEIDDPDATYVDGCWLRPERLTVAEWLEEAADLAAFGLTDKHAAERLGIDKDALQTARRRRAETGVAA